MREETTQTPKTAIGENCPACWLHIVRRHLKEHYWTLKKSLLCFTLCSFLYFFLHLVKSIKMRETDPLAPCWLVRFQPGHSPTACLLTRYKCILDFASGSLPVTRKHVPHNSYIIEKPNSVSVLSEPNSELNQQLRINQQLFHWGLCSRSFMASGGNWYRVHPLYHIKIHN